jgi:hypothetical protein
MNKLILATVAGVAVAGYVYRKELVAKVQAAVEGRPEKDVLDKMVSDLKEKIRVIREDNTPDDGERNEYQMFGLNDPN